MRHVTPRAVTGPRVDDLFSQFESLFGASFGGSETRRVIKVALTPERYREAGAVVAVRFVRRVRCQPCGGKGCTRARGSAGLRQRQFLIH